MNKTEKCIEYIKKMNFDSMNKDIVSDFHEALQHLISVAERGMDREEIENITRYVMYQNFDLDYATKATRVADAITNYIGGEGRR